MFGGKHERMKLEDRINDFIKKNQTLSSTNPLGFRGHDEDERYCFYCLINWINLKEKQMK
jgi:hypothetical protein